MKDSTTRAADTATEKALLRGLHGFFAKLKAEHDQRTRRGQPHPGTVYITPQSYAHFITAMRIVNANLQLAAPQDELYSFKGIKLRSGG